MFRGETEQKQSDYILYIYGVVGRELCRVCRVCSQTKSIKRKSLMSFDQFLQ